MRILHVTTFLQGGAGRIIAALAVGQRKAGHDVIVVADRGRHTGYESYPEYLGQLTSAGVEFRTVTSTFKRDLDVNVQAVRELRELLGPRAIDVTHTHAAIPTLIARLALSRGAHVPLVQTMHGWGIRKTPEQAATDITLLGLADAIVTPSAAARETLRGLGLDSPAVQVISYGIDERPTGDVPDAEDAPLFERVRGSGSRLAVCIGTIGERKNQALLVEALPSIKGVNALFIGDGESGPLRTLATKAGVADRVHVLGYRADASRYLPMADALVLPSRNEGLPIVVLEALRAGVPVVGSAIPEIAEAVEDGHTGFLFTPDDAGRLAAALARAMAPDRRAEMRAQARQAFEARYGADRMRANYERLYADVRAAATTRA